MLNHAEALRNGNRAEKYPRAERGNKDPKPERTFKAQRLLRVAFEFRERMMILNSFDEIAGGDGSINLSSLNTGVTQKQLNRAQICTRLKECRRASMPESVRADGLIEACARRPSSEPAPDIDARWPVAPVVD